MLNMKRMSTEMTLIFILTAYLINIAATIHCETDDGQSSTECDDDKKCCEENGEAACCEKNGEAACCNNGSSVSVVAIVIVVVFLTFFAIVIGLSFCIICYLRKYGYPGNSESRRAPAEAVIATDITPNNAEIMMEKMDSFSPPPSYRSGNLYHMRTPTPRYNTDSPSSLQTDV